MNFLQEFSLFQSGSPSSSSTKLCENFHNVSINGKAGPPWVYNETHYVKVDKPKDIPKPVSLARKAYTKAAGESGNQELADRFLEHSRIRQKRSTGQAGRSPENGGS